MTTVGSEQSYLLHNTGSLLEDITSCVCACVRAYCLLQNVGPDWGYLIAAVTMAAAAHVMRERVRETGDLVKVQFKESHCSTKGTQ